MPVSENFLNAINRLPEGVARLIATNRKPESHIAGGAVINRGESALRISKDLDIFQDTAEIVATCPRPMRYC